MTGYGFGGGVNTTSFTGYPGTYVYHTGNGMPTTNLAANGNRPITVNGLGIGSAYNAGGIYPFIDYQGSGIVGAGTWANSGGTFTFGIGYGSGTLYFGRNSGGGGTVEDAGDGTHWSGSIPGSLNYYGVPSAAQSVSATASSTVSGRVVVTWSAPADDGGGVGISGYDIYTGATLLGSVGNVLTFNADGLTPGTAYTFTVRAKNSVSTAAGTTAVASSASSSVTAPGVPTAPQSLTATPSTSVTGRINLSWAAPATPGTGGITGYNIFQNGVQIASTSGTGTTYGVTGLTGYTSYNFTVKARNAFADANGVLSVDSNTATATAPAPPGAPTSLTAIADGLVAGKIDLAWTAPAVTGTGGITGYNIYFSTGVLITATTGTGVSYSVTGLNPGQTYSFYVTARNALADAEPSQSAQSNTATAQALGEPGAPTSFTATASTRVAGRINLTWVAPAGTLTGYNVFDHNTVTLVDTLVATIKTTSYSVDGLTPGVSKTYFVRARNSYTDTLSTGYPGNYGGAASTSASATPNSDTDQTVPTVLAATDNTNTTLNGTYTINSVTPTTLRYAKTASNITSTATPSGTITNNTNAVFNGTYTVATPTTTTLTYAKTNANIPAAALSGAVVTDSTNASFNGTKTVTAVNAGAKTISYSRVDTAVSTVAVPTNALPGARGTVSNTTNAVFNGTSLVITAVTPYTIQYSKTNADITQSNAAGTVTDTTNRDDYNGTKTITSIPTYNTVTYTTAGSNQSSVAVSTPPGGVAYRAVSPAKLDIKYRSGWAG